MAMRMELHTSQKLEQRMKLSQQMLQNLELLQMPIMDLRELIVQELQDNPVLELKEDVEEQEESPSEEDTRTDAETEKSMEILEAVEEQWLESERRRPRRGSDDDADRKAEFLSNASSPSLTLREHLREQISVLEVSEGLRRHAEHIIESIDLNGFLSFPLEDLVESLPEDLKDEPPDILHRRLESALAILQKMEPRGVGARDATECLLLQLDENDEIYPLLRFLIQGHLDDISHNRLPKLAKILVENEQTRGLLGYDTEPDPAEVMEDLKFLIAELGKLNLRPGSNFAGDMVPKVYPEVVIKIIDGTYEIWLEDSYLPPISVNKAYQEMVRNRKSPKEERDFIRRKLDAGRRLIGAIEQRRGTIRRITDQILDRQKDFFEHGIEHLKPLKMQEVADSLGIHVSTVSRALAAKYVETPRGIFPMKFFFPSSAASKRNGTRRFGARTAEPDPKTRLVLKEAIREIIDDEDRKKPYSDLEIVKLLKDKNMNAARRTVAKYREELNIPSSRIRQEY